MISKTIRPCSAKKKYLYVRIYKMSVFEAFNYVAKINIESLGWLNYDEIDVHGN